jgi:hypothetical protein
VEPGGSERAEPGGYEGGNPVGYAREPGPLSGTAESLDRGGRKPFDVVFQRPLELVLLGVGAVALIPAYPVGWLFGVGPEVVEICITQPYARVVDKPLGEL